jgi:hypothetical protein
MALLHSPEYQSNVEDLYLSALDVTFQRFQFDTQFFFHTGADFEAQGPVSGGGQPQTSLTVPSSLQAKRLLPAGGQLVVGFANTLVWQFSGPDSSNLNSLLSFSLVQPLLREAGRAVVLENLTQSERGLLANLRQMEQYRRGFYVSIVAGQTPGPGPSRGGIDSGGLSPGTAIRSAGGFFGLLEEQVNIRNQRSNLAGLRDSLERLQAAYDAGRLNDRFQVDLARQALYKAQVSLVSQLEAYEDRLDNFKITLGLPPDLNVRVEDPLLRRFDLIDPALSAAMVEATQLALVEFSVQQELPSDWRNRLEAAAQGAQTWLEIVQPDLQRLAEAIPARRRHLAKLGDRVRAQGEKTDRAAYDVEAFNARGTRIAKDFQLLAEGLRQAQGRLAALPAPPPRPAAGTDEKDPARLAWIAWRSALRDRAEDFANVLGDLSLIQARARLEAVTLTEVDLTPEDALQVARQNRPDWMNARAGLVDRWRRIEIAASALKSNLNLKVNGGLGTVGNDPFRFRDTNGQVSVGVEFDAPLTRLAERNSFRETLIAYQRARRSYYRYEDRVNQGLRSVLRSMRLSQLRFEIQRAQVQVSIEQVDYARLKLQRPPKAGEKSSDNPNLGRDLVDALQALLDAQNAFLAAWVDYEAERLNLDLQLGTMRLDQRGLWIDPGTIDTKAAQGPDNVPPLPPEVLGDLEPASPPEPAPNA